MTVGQTPAVTTHTSWGRILLWLVVAAAATVSAYLVFLPWGAEKKIGPDGSLHGPYTTNEVLGLILALILIGVVTGWFSNWMAPWAVPPVLTIVWSLDAMNDVENDGLWPIGAVLVLIGATLGTLVLVLIGRAVTRRRVR